MPSLRNAALLERWDTRKHSFRVKRSSQSRSNGNSTPKKLAADDRSELGPLSEIEPLHSSPDLPVHPRLWLFLGILYIILGLTQIVLAASWRWWFGVALGLGIIKTGSSLTGLGWAGGQRVNPTPRTCLGRLKRTLLRVLLWGSTKVQQLLWRLRWLVYANGLFVALLIAIHLSSPDPHPPPTAFPAACPGSKRFGCSRVAESAPHGARHLHPLYLEAEAASVQRAAEEWVWAQTHARVLQSYPGFFHARFVTFLWGFADDFFASVRCMNSTHVVVEAQGQLRIGQSDLGVNKRRNQRFLQDLSLGAGAGGLIPEGRCQAGGGGEQERVTDGPEAAAAGVGGGGAQEADRQGG